MKVNMPVCEHAMPLRFVCSKCNEKNLEKKEEKIERLISSHEHLIDHSFDDIEKCFNKIDVMTNKIDTLEKKINDKLTTIHNQIEHLYRLDLVRTEVLKNAEIVSKNTHDNLSDSCKKVEKVILDKISVNDKDMPSRSLNLEERIRKLELHKNLQIDENIKSSRRTDELEYFIKDNLLSKMNALVQLTNKVDITLKALYENNS
jgi:hypothetical protein